MILGTYQPIDFTGVSHSPEKYSKLEEVIGYQPIFCFPCMTLRQALVESRLAAPHRAQRFILFETDDYGMIDIVKWNRVRYVGKTHDEIIEAVKDCVTDVPAISGREYLVKEVPMDKAILVVDVIDACFGSAGDYDFDGRLKFPGVVHLDEKYHGLPDKVWEAFVMPDLGAGSSYPAAFGASAAMITRMGDLALKTFEGSEIHDGDKILKYTHADCSYYSQGLRDDLLKEDKYTWDRQGLLKNVFERYPLAYILEMSGIYADELLKYKDLAEPVMELDHLELNHRLHNVYLTNDDPDAEWHTQKAFDDLYDSFLRLYSKGLVPALAEHAHIGRNDFCPCGSGRKLKKCHGCGTPISEMKDDIRKAYRNAGIDV